MTDRADQEALHALLLRRLDEIDVAPGAGVGVAELHKRLIPYPLCRETLGLATKAEYDLALLRLLADETRVRVTERGLRETVRRELKAPEPSLGILQRFAASEVHLLPEAGPTSPPEAPAPSAPPVRPGPALARKGLHAARLPRPTRRSDATRTGSPGWTTSNVSRSHPAPARPRHRGRSPRAAGPAALRCPPGRVSASARTAGPTSRGGPALRAAEKSRGAGDTARCAVQFSLVDRGGGIRSRARRWKGAPRAAIFFPSPDFGPAPGGPAAP